jgi:hypothetical protein
MLWPVAILAGLGIERVQAQLATSRRIFKSIAFVPLLALLGVEVAAHQIYMTPRAVWLQRQDAILQRLPRSLAPDTVLFVTQMEPEPRSWVELDSMQVAQDLGLQTLNGYSGRGPPGVEPAYACASFTERLIAYAKFFGLADPQMPEVAERVHAIGLGDCANAPVFLVDPQSADGRLFQLYIQSVEVIDQHIDAEVRFLNNSGAIFTTRDIQKPVRLSWRFVPVSADGSRVAEPGWNARQEIDWTIAHGESRQVHIATSLPSVPGEYLFEVTVVQENLAWFHDLGMEIPAAKVAVKSRNPG